MEIVIAIAAAVGLGLLWLAVLHWRCRVGSLSLPTTIRHRSGDPVALVTWHSTWLRFSALIPVEALEPLESFRQRYDFPSALRAVTLHLGARGVAPDAETLWIFEGLPQGDGMAVVKAWWAAVRTQIRNYHLYAPDSQCS